MDYKVVFQETFLEDLENIVRQIAAENVAAAEKLGERIVSLAEELVFFPERHPRVRQRPELRRYIAAKHYKVSGLRHLCLTPDAGKQAQVDRRRQTLETMMRGAQVECPAKTVLTAEIAPVRLRSGWPEPVEWPETAELL